MLNRETHICRDYAASVFERATRPLIPVSFSPNWDDHPSRFKIYQEVERFPLSISNPPPVSIANISTKLHAPPLRTKGLTFEEISSLLLLSSGVLNRRLDISWNGSAQVKYHDAVYGRGTPSGGGLYPTEIYWACGSSGPLLPGVYHYDNAHHAMERLAIGNVTAAIQNAVFAHPAAIATDQFLLLSLNFWKNSFKYNNLSYHLVTQDLGALLGSLRFIAAGFDYDLQFLQWYQDEKLNRLLGLTTVEESIFTVIPIDYTSEISSNSKNAYEVPDSGNNSVASPAKLNGPLVKKSSFQRSKEVLRFSVIENVHRATLVEEELRPDVNEAFKAGYSMIDITEEQIELPAVITVVEKDMLEIFQRRKSSSGKFSSQKPLSRTELATVLHDAEAACNYTTDIKGVDGSPRLTRLMVFVNNVEGIERGIYSYDHSRRCLWTIHKDDLTSFLQRHYSLLNYNIAETGVVIAIVGRLDRMIDIYGNRGYRILNVEVGIVAQNIYLISAALSIGCGAVLGFDNKAMNEVLGLERSDQSTMLFLMIGHERQNNAQMEYRLV